MSSYCLQFLTKRNYKRWTKLSVKKIKSSTKKMCFSFIRILENWRDLVVKKVRLSYVNLKRSISHICDIVQKLNRKLPSQNSFQIKELLRIYTWDLRTQLSNIIASLRTHGHTYNKESHNTCYRVYTRTRDFYIVYATRKGAHGYLNKYRD